MLAPRVLVDHREEILRKINKRHLLWRECSPMGSVAVTTGAAAPPDGETDFVVSRQEHLESH